MKQPCLLPSRPSMTIKASQFSIATVQLVAFTPERSALSPAKVLAAVMSRFSDCLNGEVQVLPIPIEAPDEIPRLELKSDDGRQLFSWSPGRLSVACSPTDSLSVESAANGCAAILSYLYQQHPVAVNRLACVVNRVAKLDNPAPELVSRFCRDEMCNPENPTAPLRRSVAFQIHNLKKYDSPIAGVRLNSWVRCKADNSNDGSRSDLIFEQDLNTPIDESRRFSSDQMTAFYSMACKEADKTLSLYFPE